MSTLKQFFASATVLATIVTLSASAQAGETVWKKPVVKQAAIGAVAGVAAGALSDKTSVGKAAATGAVVGAGTGLMSQSKYLKDKPLVRNTLQGAAIGTGTSYATGGSKLKGAAIGAGSGAGYHYVKKYLDQK